MAFYENLKAEGEISDDEDNIGNDEEQQNEQNIQIEINGFTDLSFQRDI